MFWQITAQDTKNFSLILNAYIPENKWVLFFKSKFNNLLIDAEGNNGFLLKEISSVKLQSRSLSHL